MRLGENRPEVQEQSKRRADGSWKSARVPSRKIDEWMKGWSEDGAIADLVLVLDACAGKQNLSREFASSLVVLTPPERHAAVAYTLSPSPWFHLDHSILLLISSSSQSQQTRSETKCALSLEMSCYIVTW